MNAKDDYLYNIGFMRPVCMVLIIVYHCFLPHLGSDYWPVPGGYDIIPAFSWIAKLAIGFPLPCFVFISGFVFGRKVLMEKPNGGGISRS